MRAARPDLDAVFRRFVRWRARRPRGRALPRRLWQAAVDLLGDYPASTICRRLNLNHSRFNRARETFGRPEAESAVTGGNDRSRRSRRGRRPFVELPALSLVHPGPAVEGFAMRGECRVVVETARARLSVEFARFDSAWLGSACRLLLEASGGSPLFG